MTSFAPILRKEETASLRAAWRALAHSGKATAGDHLLYAVLSGRDPLRAFAPVTNATKLANGQGARAGLLRALRELQGYYRTSLRRERAHRLVALDDQALASLLERLNALCSSTSNTGAR